MSFGRLRDEISVSSSKLLKVVRRGRPSLFIRETMQVRQTSRLPRTRCPYQLPMSTTLGILRLQNVSPALDGYMCRGDRKSKIDLDSSSQHDRVPYFGSKSYQHRLPALEELCCKAILVDCEWRLTPSMVKAMHPYM